MPHSLKRDVTQVDVDTRSLALSAQLGRVRMQAGGSSGYNAIYATSTARCLIKGSSNQTDWLQ
jgi:hypothetical protein